MERDTEDVQHNIMRPPPPRTFKEREELITYVRDFGVSQGYVMNIKKSKKDISVVLCCDRGGDQRNRNKTEPPKRKRKESSRLINCPFEVVGKKEGGVWELRIRNGEHNHEPLKDMSEHRYSRRFSEEEAKQVKEMIEAGLKPRQVLETLKQSNPQLLSTPRHLYNLKAKIREGNFSEKSFKLWRPNVSAVGASSLLCDNSDKVQQNKLSNFIGGKFVESQGTVFVDVVNPATQEVVSQVPSTTYEEFKAAVFSAKEAFTLWKNTPIFTRQRMMIKLQELILRDKENLALIISTEQGKTIKSAHADILHWLEVVEQACEISAQQWGEFVANASNAIDTYSIREPLGVCAGICNSDFSAMAPLWMFPVAVTCGNTFVLKPSEKNPGASMKLAALATEAGLPDGVLNIVHGGYDIVNYVCDDDDIKAISFVGSSMDGIDIHAKATGRGKRFEASTGFKNQAVVMPDACMDATLDALIASGFVASGDPCMSLSSVIFIGHATPWEEELVKRAKSLIVNGGTDATADLGPVVSKEVKDDICRSVNSAVESGARLILDGRNIMIPGYEDGNFIGPTILSGVTPSMKCYKEDIFGPVLLCTQAHSLEEAIMIVNRYRFGNGASIFTTSGIAAKKFQNEVEIGLIGINVPVPFLLRNTSAGLTASSGGKAGIHFYTQVKMVAQQWRDLTKGIMSSNTLTSDREERNQAFPVTVALSSDTDLSSHESLSVTKSSSGEEMTDQEKPGNNLCTQSDFSCSAASMSLASTSEVRVPNEAVPLTAASLTMSRELDHQLYYPQTSCFEALSSTSQGLDDLMNSNAARICMSRESQGNGLDSQLGVTPEYTLVASEEAKHMFQGGLACTDPPSTSEGMCVPSFTHEKIEPTVQRLYIPTITQSTCDQNPIGEDVVSHDQAL